MSPVDSHNELNRRMNILLDLGLKIDMIKFHPDSVFIDDGPFDIQKRKEVHRVSYLVPS